MIEILKQPLQTSVAIDTADFESFSVVDKLHVGISVKDFRAIVTHASTLRTTLTASYSQPTRPLQLAYECGGMLCEFTLMTIGDCRDGSTTPGPAVFRGVSTRPSQRQESAPVLERNIERPAKSAPQRPSQFPTRSFIRDYGSQRPTRPSPPPSKPSIDPASLFLPHEDDDRQWDEKNNGEADEDMLGWDVSADNVSRSTTLHCMIGANSRIQDGLAGNYNRTIKDQSFSFKDEVVNNVDRDDSPRIAPTQRISQVMALIFNDLTRAGIADA